MRCDLQPRGFPRQTCDFMKDLDENNSTDWFARAKPRYQSEVVAPLKSVIGALQSAFVPLDHKLNLSYRVNTTVMRINRDRRFQPSAPPYRNYIKVSFPLESYKWSTDPVLGFGVFPNYFYVAFRNAGKQRQDFCDRFERNMRNHQPLVQRWVETMRVDRHLNLLGGAHDAINTLGQCPKQAATWMALKEPTVGYIWSDRSIAAGACTFNDVKDKLIILYFLKLMAVSDDLDTAGPAYIAKASELCKSLI